jgi:hypothetical protein
MPSTKGEKKIFYRHGKTKIYLEPAEDTFAIRFDKKARPNIEELLRSLGFVREVESENLSIVELNDPARQEALGKLRELLDAGEIEFITPVLRDKESQLLQILTDEITVRLKPNVTLKQLKSAEKKYGFRVARENEFVPNQFILKLTRPAGLHTLEVANELAGMDEVEFAAPNFISEYRR